MNKQQIGAAFSKNVKYVRAQLNLSQEAFAKVVNIKRPNVAAIEEGRSMSIESAYKISRYLRVTLDTLLTTDMETAKYLED